MAKEITGIIFNAQVSHAAGHVEEGDIVIIADNRIGGDDGGLSERELALLNIRDKEIRQGDILVAAGIYGNGDISAQYKFLHNHLLDTPLKLDTNYMGFHVVASVDLEKKETRIQVNDAVFRLGYFNSVGNMVVIDGSTGEVKFFQAKGYRVRDDDLGRLLRGESGSAKST